VAGSEKTVGVKAASGDAYGKCTKQPRSERGVMANVVS
jgi:hypothetical protein